MLANGELAAGFQGNAGVGRAGSPASGWKTIEANYPDLFPNAATLEAEWYQRTGIYPLHGTIVVKDSVLDAHPDVAKCIFDAFSKAKKQWLARLDANGAGGSPGNKKYSGLRQIVGHDPLPYGLGPNLASIKALEEIGFRQGLTERRMSVEELFVDPVPP